MDKIRLNIGCGYDKVDGYINIDGNPLHNPDILMCFPKDSILTYFSNESVDEILMQDFLEHNFRWEAESILHDCFIILKKGGLIKIRVPDFFKIIIDPRLKMEKKISLLYGGQNIPQGEKDQSHRKKYPEYFCHKYAYTKKTLSNILATSNFINIKTKSAKTNFWITASK